MAAKSSPLASLTLAIRLAEPCSYNLSQYVVEQREILAPLLGVSAEVLLAVDGLPDGELAPKLGALLRRRAEEDERRRRDGVQERAAVAGATLVRAARWEGLRAHVDVDVLLGELVVDVRNKYITLYCPDVFEVAVIRAKLGDIARATRNYNDLAAYIDADGLHIRWHEGRGGLNLLPQHVDRKELDRVLRVTFVRSLPARRELELRVPVRRQGAWLQDVLGELGLIP